MGMWRVFEMQKLFFARNDRMFHLASQIFGVGAEDTNRDTFKIRYCSIVSSLTYIPDPLLPFVPSRGNIVAPTKKRGSIVVFVASAATAFKTGSQKEESKKVESLERKEAGYVGGKSYL